MDNKSRDVALQRYSLVREAADPALKPSERGELVRALASVGHLGPEGDYFQVSRRTPDGRPPKVFGRFEALAPNDLWTGDALHGPVVADRKSYLFACIDDHSRLLPGYRWGHAEDTLRLEAALRAGLAARGVPKGLYVDNGNVFVSRWLERACGVLGIRLVHSEPGKPAGRGKIA